MSASSGLAMLLKVPVLRMNPVPRLVPSTLPRPPVIDPLVPSTLPRLPVIDLGRQLGGSKNLFGGVVALVASAVLERKCGLRRRAGGSHHR